MQRPRRTSEFLDETARNSAQKLRATLRMQTTPSTAQKYSRRCTAIGTRNTSLERSNALPGSRGTTPMCSQTISRTLFPTSAIGGVALHNDKKFIQEQTQRITEHLRAASAGHSALEFIKQTGLRQMSIKQFVAVANYFLYFMAGNRLSIGTNHVEDIAQALQKLQYPYAINKSWLKTPNTQHSYGNVVVLLNYMLDFVPPLDTYLDWLFLLQDVKGHCSDQSFANDLEFQREIMLHCEHAFPLWDKQLMNEYANMQKLTCDLYIKACSQENKSSLEHSINKLCHDFAQLQPKCSPEILNLHRKLLDERNELFQEKQNLQIELQLSISNKNKIQHKLKFNSHAIIEIEQVIEELQQQIQKQVCTVEQRDVVIEQLYQHKNVAKTQERTLSELQDKNNRQQIELSRIKNHLTDNIENFNLIMRELSEIVLDTGAVSAKYAIALANGQLQLPMKLKPEQLESAVNQLTSLNEQIDKNMMLLQLEMRQATLNLDHSENEIRYYLLPHFEEILAKLAQTKNVVKKQESQEQILDEYLQRRRELNIEVGKHELTLMELSIEMDKQRELIVTMVREHEILMRNAEVKHKTRVIAKEIFLTKVKQQLDKNMKESLKLQQVINERVNIEDAKK